MTYQVTVFMTHGVIHSTNYFWNIVSFRNEMPLLCIAQRHTTQLWLYFCFQSKNRLLSGNIAYLLDSGAGGGRSNKERQKLQPLASVARAPLLRSGEWGFTHSLIRYIYIRANPPYTQNTQAA